MHLNNVIMTYVHTYIFYRLAIIVCSIVFLIYHFKGLGQYNSTCCLASFLELIPDQYRYVHTLCVK